MRTLAVAGIALLAMAGTAAAGPVGYYDAYDDSCDNGAGYVEPVTYGYGYGYGYRPYYGGYGYGYRRPYYGGYYGGYGYRRPYYGGYYGGYGRRYYGGYGGYRRY